MDHSHLMSRRQFMGRTLMFGAAGLGSNFLSMTSEAKERLSKPNFIIILCDNLGYGDIGCFGSTRHRTPHIDRMAEEGMRFTDFYATSGVCTPSRASLMTGCYPRRVNMHIAEDGRPVLSPVAKKGLHPKETTIAEVLKAQGYATACIGKWHLGDQLPFLPTRQGFDYYLGIPYSDDMTQRAGRNWPPLPLMENEKVIEAPGGRNLLTRRYTEAKIKFIKTNREKPFFIYLPHAMPGSTKAPFASERFRGKSANGPWGDSIEELDWSTGEILRALKQLDLDEKTLVVWASDNGAPRRNPPQGLNTPLAGWGFSTAPVPDRRVRAPLKTTAPAWPIWKAVSTNSGSPIRPPSRNRRLRRRAAPSTRRRWRISTSAPFPAGAARARTSRPRPSSA